MPDRGLTKFPPPNNTQLLRKYDVMVQDGDFDCINNQEARSANIHLVKSITVFVFDGLENTDSVISYDMFVFDLTFI